MPWPRAGLERSSSVPIRTARGCTRRRLSLRSHASLLMLLVTAAGCSNAQPAPTRPTAAPSPSGPVATAMAAPDGFADAGGSWLRVKGQGLSAFVNVQKPSGDGPFPLVVYVPGQAGLTASEVRWAAKLADVGYLVVMGCLSASDTPPACQSGPPSTSLDQLVRASLLTPGARQGPIGAFGISAGAPMVLFAAGTRVIWVPSSPTRRPGPANRHTYRSCFSPAVRMASFGTRSCVTRRLAGLRRLITMRAASTS